MDFYIQVSNFILQPTNYIKIMHMAIRNIMNYKTDNILRKKSRIVEKIDSRMITLLDNMAETMYQANGAGLAAVQVGILKQSVMIDVGEGLIKLINPVIVSSTKPE